MPFCIAGPCRRTSIGKYSVSLASGCGGLCPAGRMSEPVEEHEAEIPVPRQRCVSVVAVLHHSLTRSRNRAAFNQVVDQDAIRLAPPVTPIPAVITRAACGAWRYAR
jgi:hypothetical protein